MTARPWDCGEVERCAKGTTRIGCMRRAAVCLHMLIKGEIDDREWTLRWTATWRAAGKAIPRRIGMVCARARRRHRRRMVARNSGARGTA